jgi:type II secretory pathway pseudopilin PulG
MTLIELLVAFGVFLILVGLLVSLSTTGLETWQEGEARKDAFDRARLVLDQVGEDLRNTFADTQWFLTEDRRLLHAGMYCDVDGAGQRLRFVRVGHEDAMWSDPDRRLVRPRNEGLYTDLWEVAYALNPEGRPSGLYRGVRYFDRNDADATLLEGRTIQNTKSPNWNRAFSLVDSGVLWIGYRFWTKYTNTWDAQFPVKQGPRQIKQQDTKKESVDGKGRIGPHQFWDSSRGKITEFRLFYKQLEADDPDFAYPEIVQVTVVVESQSAEVIGAKLAEAIDESATTVLLSSSRGVPEAPDFVLVGKEWISYKGKDGPRLTECVRGVRRSKAAPHALNDTVRFGETFVTDVAIPAYREPQR